MKGLDEDECSVKPVPFTVQYIKCVFFPLFFFTAYGFSFHDRGERWCSEDSVCARVGWALLHIYHFTSCSCFADNHLPSLASKFIFSPLACSFFSFSSSSPPHFFLVVFLCVFLHIFPLPLPLSLPQRSHESLVVCLLEGIPTPPPPPLEPRSFLPSLAPFSSLFLSLYLFFFLHLFLMWKFWAIAGCFCGLVGMAFLEECLMPWLRSIPESPLHRARSLHTLYTHATHTNIGGHWRWNLALARTNLDCKNPNAAPWSYMKNQ